MKLKSSVALPIITPKSYIFLLCLPIATIKYNNATTTTLNDLTVIPYTYNYIIADFRLNSSIDLFCP